MWLPFIVLACLAAAVHATSPLRGTNLLAPAEHGTLATSIAIRPAQPFPYTIAASAFAAGSEAATTPGKNPFAYLTNQSALDQEMPVKVSWMATGSGWLQEHGHLRGSKLQMYLSRTALWGIIWIQALIILCAVAFPAIAYYLSVFIGEAIRLGIEEFDQEIIGVDVEIKSLIPNIFFGIVQIEEMVIRNPDGWESPYLLRIGTLLVDFDMSTLISSFFQTVEVERLVFKDVHVNVEKGWKSSNVQDVLDFMGGKKKQAKQEEPTKQVDTGEEKAGQKKQELQSEPVKAKAVQEEEEEQYEWIIHEVDVVDVGARIQGKMVGGRGFVLSLGDIKYRDFTEEVGKSMLDDVVRVLLKSVLKTVVSNVLGNQWMTLCSKD